MQRENRDHGLIDKPPGTSANGQGDPYSALRRMPPLGSAASKCFLEPCIEDAVTCDGALELTISGLTLMKHFSVKNIFYVVISVPPFRVVTAPALYHPFDRSRAAKARRSKLSKIYGRQKGVVDFDMPQCFRMLVLAGTMVRLEVWRERLGVVDEGPYAACTLQIPKRIISSLGGKDKSERAISVTEESQGGELELENSKYCVDEFGDSVEDDSVVGPTSYRLVEPHTDGHTRGTIQVEIEMMPKPGSDKDLLKGRGETQFAENERTYDHDRFRNSTSSSLASPAPTPTSDAFKKITTAEMLRLVCSDSSGVFRLDAALGRAHSRCLVLALVSCHIAEALLQGTIEAVQTETPRAMGWVTETAWEVKPGREIADTEDWAGGYARHLRRVVQQSPGLDLNDLLALLSDDLIEITLPGWSAYWDENKDVDLEGAGYEHECEWKAVDEKRGKREANVDDVEAIHRENRKGGKFSSASSTASTLVSRTAELLLGLGRFALDGISLATDVTTGGNPSAARRDVLVTTAAAARRKRERRIANLRLERSKSEQFTDSSWTAPLRKMIRGVTEQHVGVEDSYEERSPSDKKCRTNVAAAEMEEQKVRKGDNKHDAIDACDPAWEEDVCGTRRLGVEADPLLKIDIMNRMRRIGLDNASRGRAFEIKWRSPTRIQRDAMRGLRSKRWLPPPPPAREPPAPNNKHRLHRQVFVLAAIASLETPVPLFDADELRQPSLSCGSLMDYATEVGS